MSRAQLVHERVGVQLLVFNDELSAGEDGYGVEKGGQASKRRFLVAEWGVMMETLTCPGCVYGAYDASRRDSDLSHAPCSRKTYSFHFTIS